MDWLSQRTAEISRLDQEQKDLRELQASVDARHQAIEERQAQLDASHAQHVAAHQQLVKFQQEMEEARRVLTVDRAALVDERDHMCVSIVGFFFSSCPNLFVVVVVLLSNVASHFRIESIPDNSCVM